MNTVHVLPQDMGPHYGGPDESVRRVVRMLLGARDRTVMDLAGALGLSRSAAYARLRGTKPFTVTELIGMGEFFEVDPVVFLRGPDELLGSLGRPPAASGGLAVDSRPSERARPHRPSSSERYVTWADSGLTLAA
jgi:hypothetical protein